MHRSGLLSCEWYIGEQRHGMLVEEGLLFAIIVAVQAAGGRFVLSFVER